MPCGMSFYDYNLQIRETFSKTGQGHQDLGVTMKLLEH